VYGKHEGRQGRSRGVEAPLMRTGRIEADLDEALRRCARGERAALRAIYDAEAPRMLGVALRILRRPSLAEEAVHDAFVQVWQRAAGFDPARGAAKTWLYAVLRHRALNILRGEARTDLVEDFEPMGLASEEESPETVIARLSEAGALRHCLEGLEPGRRNAVILAYMHGLSHGELARKVGVPLGTMKSWLRRSLIALRECLA
jgi:RNA polymerase sigma factor (sigma-70 family)